MRQCISFLLLLMSFVVFGQNFHTEFEYCDALNNGIILKNSYPKGGLKYQNDEGKEFVYVVFWTSLTNATDANLVLDINFTNEPFIIKTSPNVKFNLFLAEEMTLKKIQLMDYGLDVKSFLDANLKKSTKLKITIEPNDTYRFYSVAISNKGITGVVRAGFQLENKNLVYKINDHLLNCGKIINKHN